MKNLIKSGITVSAIAVLSLVGFTAAFGYGGGGGGGGGWTPPPIDPRCVSPVKPPIGGIKFKASSNDVTDSNVNLDINGGDAEYMMVSDNADFTGATLEPYAPSKTWKLPGGFGSKFVWIRFFNHCKVPTNAYSFWFNYHNPFSPISKPPVRGRVLGAQAYADGTLLRGSDNKVYAVVSGQLVYITGPSQLMKYVGREILKVDDSVIANWGAETTPAVLGTQTYANGTLIRGSDHRIYVLTNGKKVYINSLIELAKKHIGKPILDVGDDVVAQY